MELEVKEKFEVINSKIDAKLNENINSYPKAIYFIVPNELCERFCYCGISALKFKFLMTGYGLTVERAKVFTHLFTSLNYITPLIGASISDSYLGKYQTIVAFSIIYLISIVLISIFSINGLLGEFGNYPILSFLIPAFLFALGTGGIKACIASHGGDQFLPSQTRLRDNFFSIFYAIINIGGLAALFLTPYIRTYVDCFGSPCYFLAFGISAIAFFISFSLFIIGSRYYRIVSPQGEFLLWKSIKLICLAVKRQFKASPVERKAKKHWLQFAQPEYEFDFIEETRLLAKVTVMFFPIIFYFSLFSQSFTEWQKHYEKMNKVYLGLIYIPTEASSNINMILIIILVPVLKFIVYPYLEKKGYHFTLLSRMVLGYFLVILSFIVAVILESFVDQYTDTMIIKNKSVISCQSCLNGAWQLPQILLLSLGEALFAPSGLQFGYIEVGSQLKASAYSMWLLTVSFGNGIIIGMEFLLHDFTSQTRQWIHIVISSGGLIMLIFLSNRWFISKQEEENAPGIK